MTPDHQALLEFAKAIAAADVNAATLDLCQQWIVQIQRQAIALVGHQPFVRAVQKVPELKPA